MKTEEKSLTIWESWCDFWFHEIETARIQRTRTWIGCAVGLLFGCLMVTGPKWFGQDGWFDPTAGLFLVGSGSEGNGVGAEYRWSPFYNYPSLIVPVAVIGLLSGLALAFGRFAVIASSIAFVCLVFFHHRAPLLVTRSEPLLAASLFYMALIPSKVSNSQWSFLRTVGFRLLQVHFFLWIGFSLVSMLGNEGWWTGTAMYQLIVDEQGLLPRSWATPNVVEVLMHVVLGAQMVMLVCILNTDLRPLGIWATLLLVMAIILVLADWMYAVALLAASTSCWRIPFFPLKKQATTK